MEGNCPHCQVRLDLPASGAYLCERCNQRFEVALGSPTPPPVQAPAYPAAAPPYGAPGYHPGYTAGFPQAPPAADAPEPVTLPTGLQAPCAYHAENLAASVCERCGDFMCRLCTTAVEGRGYCPRCFELLYQRGSLQVAHRQFSLPVMTFTLGLTALLGLFVSCGCLSLPLGVGGIVAGIRAMREYRERPDLPQRGLAISGIVMSVLSLVAVVGIIVFFIVAAPHMD